MNYKLLFSLSALTLMLGFSSIADASGGYGGSRGSGSLGGSSGSFGNSSLNRVDQSYEIGKSIYKGRRGNAKIAYCVELDGEKVPLRRKTVKPFKQSSVNEFVDNLYNCDKLDQLISDYLDTEQFAYVLYYLNKRYKLNLS